MKNEVIVNSADYKFADFTGGIGEIASDFHGEDWYVKMQEIDAKIHQENLQDKITFSDDRLVLIAYHVMINTGVFDSSAQLREWWIVQRYLDNFAPANTPQIEALRRLVNMYIGFAFSGAQMDKEHSSEFKSLCKTLSKVIYDDGYIQVPQFVLDVIDNGEFEKPEEEQGEFEFTGDEQVQWEGLKETAEMMLGDSDSLSTEEKEQWQGALDTAKMMLGE